MLIREVMKSGIIEMEDKYMIRKEIKQQAKDVLKGGKWIMLFVVLLIVGAVSSLTGGLLAPLGMYALFLIVREMLEGKEMDFNHLATPFKDLNHAIKVIVVGLLTGLIVSIGMMLFFIPGIIFMCMYVQAVRIMVEKPELSIMEALKESKEMMSGYKMDYFVFMLSFIGHYLLTAITFGIWGLYFGPLFVVADTNYYLHLKKIRTEAAAVKEVKAEVVE